MRFSFFFGTFSIFFAFSAYFAKASQLDACSAPEIDLEKRAAKANTVIKALMVDKYEENGNAFVAEFWILDVYKGADKLSAAFGLEGDESDRLLRLKDKYERLFEGAFSRCITYKAFLRGD